MTDGPIECEVALTEVGGLLVDLRGISTLSHVCDPTLCAASGCCCAEHDVWVGDAERSAALGILPEAAEHAPAVGETDPFQRLGDDAWSVRRIDGMCVFAWRDDGGRTLCSLHSAALQRGLPPEQTKPRGCILWPLALSSSRPPMLSVQAGALRYPCNCRRGLDGRLSAGVEAIVAAIWGRTFLRELRGAVAALGPSAGRDGA